MPWIVQHKLGMYLTHIPKGGWTGTSSLWEASLFDKQSHASLAARDQWLGGASVHYVTEEDIAVAELLESL